MPSIDELQDQQADSQNQPTNQPENPNQQTDSDDNPPKPEPHYVTAEELQSFGHDLANSIREGMESLRPAPAVTPETELPDPDPDNDDPVTIARKVIAKELRPVMKRIQQFEAFGTGTLAEIGSRMDADKMPHYKEYKREIDAYWNNLAPHIKAQPGSKKAAHDFVVAGHIGEITERAREEGRRQAVKGEGDPAAPTGRGRNGKPQAGVPTPQELGFSEQQIEEIEERRGGWDAWARRMSGGRYSGYADYAKAHLKRRGKAA